MAKKPVQSTNETNSSAVKHCLEGNIALNSYIRKEERSQISGLNQRSANFSL